MSRWRRPRGGRLRRLLRLDRIHHGQILSREALVVLPGFVQEHAVAVIALLATEVRGHEQHTSGPYPHSASRQQP